MAVESPWQPCGPPHGAQRIVTGKTCVVSQVPNCLEQQAEARATGRKVKASFRFARRVGDHEVEREVLEVADAEAASGVAGLNIR